MLRSALMRFNGVMQRVHPLISLPIYPTSLSATPVIVILRRGLSKTNSNKQAPTEHKFIVPERIIGSPSDDPIKITEPAAKRLGEIFEEKHSILRILVESGGCHGYQYNMKLESADGLEKQDERPASSVNEDDEFDEFDVKDIIYVLPDNKGEIILDEQSHKVLSNTILTYTKELIGSSFKILGGKMTSSCGCGSSFGVESDESKDK